MHMAESAQNSSITTTTEDKWSYNESFLKSKTVPDTQKVFNQKKSRYQELYGSLKEKEQPKD